MYHSVTFGNKNTWDNWHIVPSSRPVFEPPKQKTNILDIQGGNGFIDLSEALTDECRCKRVYDSIYLCKSGRSISK